MEKALKEEKKVNLVIQLMSCHPGCNVSFWFVRLNVVSLVMMIEYLILDYNTKLTCANNEEYRADQAMTVLIPAVTVKMKHSGRTLGMILFSN